jgi:long-chain acyl-CoA synthetase
VTVSAPDDPRLPYAERGLITAYWAQQRGDQPAIVAADGMRTWRELDARANQVARALRAAGLGAGDAVVLLCANRAEFIEVHAAVHRTGMRLTPVNWHLTSDEVAYIAEDCEARAVIADARFGGVAADVASRLTGLAACLWVREPIEGYEGFEEVIASFSGDDLGDAQLGSAMLYTSGTTGRPKGVHRTGESVQATVRTALALTSGYDPDRHRSLCTGPLYHAAPLTFSVNLPVQAGVTVVLMDGWGAEETLRLIEEHGVTHCHMVPTMFHRLISLPDEVRESYDVSSMRYIIHGAAPCPVEVKRRMIDWFGPIVNEYYAATEGLGTFVNSNEWLERPGTVGRPAIDGLIRVLDPEGDDLPPGEVGTVYLRSADGSRFDYFKDEEKTLSAYRGDHFTLGDMGYFDEDGYLFLTDRSAHLIISGGVNIYPAETEAVLLEHPAVGDAGVVGVPSIEMGEDVLAAVELQDGVEPSDELARELIAFCRDRLAHYKCPKYVEFVDRLPRHDNGKLYKHQLRDRFREQYSPAP